MRIILFIFPQVLDDKSVRRRFRASNYQVFLLAFTYKITFVVDTSVRAFCSQRRVSNLSFVQCPCGSMKDGIKSNSISLTSPVVLMVLFALLLLM